MQTNPTDTPEGVGAGLDGAESPMPPEVQAPEQTAAANPETDGLKAEVERLKAELKQAEDQVLRTMAEFQNFRRRKDQEAEQFRQFATERLVTSLLPVLDNFERTLAALESGAPIETVIEGIRLVDRQFRSALESNNVKRIDSHGQPFDPDVHEAISTEPSEEHPENTVVGEVEAGYRMADKVIRPARVRVSTKP